MRIFLCTFLSAVIEHQKDIDSYRKYVALHYESEVEKMHAAQHAWLEERLKELAKVRCMCLEDAMHSVTAETVHNGPD
jgi:hypothetical protein